MSVKNFVESWRGRGYEKGETQKFWLAFLRELFNISEPEKFINFEVPVKLQHTNFIDAFFPDTKVIIEQKSLSENFSALKPYEQAQKYISGLPVSLHPQKIIVCNFAEFFIYDMETLDEPQKILLSELPEKFHAFDFLIDANKNKIRIELELSLQAGEIVAKLYDALRKNYINPNDENSLQSLNKLCVRLVFCLYAESAGIFGKHKIFRDYLQGSRNIRQDLILLFEVLDTPEKNRDPYLADELKIFPYVNGGLFSDKTIEIPNFTAEIKNLLLDEASSGFNWAGISPTIFGALFESTLNPVTRRSGGEKTRIALAKLILTGANFLILDEPTNHLDLPAREAIENALKNFDGTILIVTHDRYLLDEVATRIIEFAAPVKIESEKIQKPEKVQKQKVSSEKKSPPKKEIPPELMEAKIKMAEIELEMIEREINSSSDSAKLTELAAEHEKKLQEIDELLAVWIED